MAQQGNRFGRECLSLDRVRVMHVTTSHLSVGLMRGQLRYLLEAGFDIAVVSSPGKELDAAARDEHVQTFAVSTSREIAFLTDLLSLWRLWRLMRRMRPTIANVGSPKAGLLGGLAAWLSGVPCRVYTLRGLRCETAIGLKRWVLLLSERIACRCAHRVICVSESLRQKAVELRVVDPARTVVFGPGSGNGVDAARFAPTPERLADAASLRRKLGIPLDAPVVGFVGRLTRDKGVVELVKACFRLRGDFPSLRLLLLGEPERGDPLPLKTLEAIANDPQVICPGFLDDTAPFYQVMDVLALPTHREGFPNVVLEAHAAGKPVVAARATGVVDALIDGVNGILIPVGDTAALAHGLEQVLRNPALAAALGRAGRERILREFRQDLIWDALSEEYLRLLSKKGLPLPAPANELAKAAVVPN